MLLGKNKTKVFLLIHLSNYICTLCALEVKL
jgi:hypothetical protein